MYSATIKYRGKPVYTRRSNNKTGFVASLLVVIAITLIVLLLTALFYGFVVMILAGVLHSVAPAVPAIGYPISCVIGLLLALLFNNGSRK